MILNDSKWLQEKYSQPVYGTEIKSLNFPSKIWVEYDENGLVKDPYSLLDPIFKDLTTDQLNEIVGSQDALLNDGGAAMMAYAKIQFTNITDVERENYIKALLCYCELDTLAMVMIYEHWKSMM